LEKRIVDPKDRSEKTLKAKIRFMVLFYFGANQDNTESLPWNWQKAEVRLVNEDTDHFETLVASKRLPGPLASRYVSRPRAPLYY